MISITAEKKRQLRSQAHSLKPVVLLGSQGLTEAVHKEIDQVLHDHQLVKIRLVGEDREARQALSDEICSRHHAALIQRIGHIIVVFRPRPVADK